MARYEVARYDYWKWQCALCSGRNWRGWNCANCGWEWKPAGQDRDAPLILPAQDTAEDQDAVMQVSSPCQTETMRAEASTIPIPKAAPIGARLDSVLARQTRARRAYETARRMLAIARQRMEETTKEMEQANAPVENAKRKFGPATGVASDVATLLDMLKPHLNTLSVNAADLVARIEGDMKVTKTDEENIKEEMKHEVPGETQPTQLDKPVSDAQEIASQLQAMEAMRGAEEEDIEKLRRARIEAGKYANTSPPSLTESLNNAANSIREQRPEAQTTTTAPSSSSTFPTNVAAKTTMTTIDKEIIEDDREGVTVTETLKQAIGSDWCELEETMKTSIARAVQDRFKPY